MTKHPVLCLFKEETWTTNRKSFAFMAQCATRKRINVTALTIRVRVRGRGWKSMKTQKVLDAILEGLDGAQSSEADRIRESIPWLAPSEKKKLAQALTTAFTADQLFSDEEE